MFKTTNKQNNTKNELTNGSCCQSLYCISARISASFNTYYKAAIKQCRHKNG